MQKCPLAGKCIRLGYTRYLLAENRYPGGLPPTRIELRLKGYLGEEAMQPRPNGKPGGVYAETMPQPEDPQSFCPEVSFDSHENCHEYNKEIKRQERKRKREKEYMERYPNARRFKRIPENVRREVAKSQNYHCYYCERHLRVVKSEGGRMEVDHIIPRALGGGDERSNLVLSCSNCNNEKKANIWEKGCRIGEA